MKFIAAFTVLFAIAGTLLLAHARLTGLGFGAVTGLIVGAALKAFPTNEDYPDDDDHILDRLDRVDAKKPK